MPKEMTNALITNAGRYAASDTSSVANIADGGQYGIGNNLINIDAATPLVLPPATVIVTHAPTMFEFFPNAVKNLKSIIERHPTEVTGIDWGLQLESSAVPAGHDGQELHMPTNSKRTPVTPSFTLPELNGMLIWYFFKFWIECIKHPDTHASLMSALQPNTNMSPQLLSYFTMDICVIQYDVTKRPENILAGYFITNMWPQETGLGGFQRQINNENRPDRQIPFYGVVQENKKVFASAQKIARALNAHAVNYDYATPVADEIPASLSTFGISQEIAEDIANFTSVS